MCRRPSLAILLDIACDEFKVAESVRPVLSPIYLNVLALRGLQKIQLCGLRCFRAGAGAELRLATDRTGEKRS